ncbi:hypothetical protein VTN77DRAFT_2026 [Rasamsonia byssochlamydoides]|uniref:uncharacterized protein n=1 Tax=Rasamsonia byssochlamydoides TaxID=89139 RepID=UPI003743F496
MIMSFDEFLTPLSRIQTSNVPHGTIAPNLIKKRRSTNEEGVTTYLLVDRSYIHVSKSSLKCPEDMELTEKVPSGLSYA